MQRSESTLRYMQQLQLLKYCSQVQAIVPKGGFACAKCKDVHDISSLPPKKLRQPHTLEESLDTDIHALQLAGTPANCGLVLAAAEDIGMSKEITLLSDNRGHVALTRMGIFSLEVNVLCHTERVK